MNSIEFVKKFGIAVAKDLAYRDKTSIGYLSVEHHSLNQDDLKQIVEAFELVESYGGLTKCQFIVVDPLTMWDTTLLKQAINLVEQCQ